LVLQFDAQIIIIHSVVIFGPRAALSKMVAVFYPIYRASLERESLKSLIAIVAISTIAAGSAQAGSRSKDHTATVAPAPVATSPAAKSGATGVNIQGNTTLKASQVNAAAIGIGEGNTARNAVGAIRGGTTIKGNTNINAKSKNTAAIAIGKNNSASNQAGVIGGN
jgi:hypothetical protein